MLRGGSVRIFDVDGSRQAVGHVEDGATLSTYLRPGTYRVEVRSGDARCEVRLLTVRAGSNIQVHVPCSVR
jgi:hypothetical protein